MRKLAAATLLMPVLAVAACGGGGSSPSAPSNSTPAPAPAPTPAPTPTPAPMATPTPDPAPQDPMVLRRATIRGANGHNASGNAQIVRRGNSYVLELLNNFRIDSGNNDVCLTRSPSICQSGDLNLGDMRSLTGSQSYPMPNEGSEYSYVMLWCRPFRVPIGIGELR